MVSRHYKDERNHREEFIEKYLGGDGRVVDSFIVDKHHPHGLERHDITDNGIIVIYNVKTNKLVSKLIAREGQIKRYYYNSGREPPYYLIRIARRHENLGYNNV